MMRILAISGSLRTGSYNRALLYEARTLAPEGVEIIHCHENAFTSELGKKSYKPRNLEIERLHRLFGIPEP